MTQVWLDMENLEIFSKKYFFSVAILTESRFAFLKWALIFFYL